MSNQMPIRRFRAADDLWETFQAKAKERGEVPSKVIRGMIEDYCAEGLPGYAGGFAAGVDAGRRAAVATFESALVATKIDEG